MRVGRGATDGDPVDAARRLRVLLVDDEPDLRLLVRRQLGRAGFEVVGEAADGCEAVEAARRLSPDVILLDLMMPRPGDEALPHLLSVAPRCMVVVLSGAEAGVVRERLLSLGAYAYLDKARIAELPAFLREADRCFRAALEGEDGLPLWATAVD